MTPNSAQRSCAASRDAAFGCRKRPMAPRRCNGPRGANSMSRSSTWSCLASPDWSCWGSSRKSHPDCEVLLLTGQGTIETAVEAMKRGAYDFLTKPFPLAELEVLIQKAYERHQLQKENKQLSAALERTEPTFEIIGNSAPMREVFRLIDRAGPTDKAILIQGASGTGKELVARALHRASCRCSKTVHRDQLRGPSRVAARERTVRPRKRSLHRRHRHEAGTCSKWPTAERC